MSAFSQGAPVGMALSPGPDTDRGMPIDPEDNMALGSEALPYDSPRDGDDIYPQSGMQMMPVGSVASVGRNQDLVEEDFHHNDKPNPQPTAKKWQDRIPSWLVKFGFAIVYVSPKIKDPVIRRRQAFANLISLVFAIFFLVIGLADRTVKEVAFPFMGYSILCYIVGRTSLYMLTGIMEILMFIALTVIVTVVGNSTHYFDHAGVGSVLVFPWSTTALLISSALFPFRRSYVLAGTFAVLVAVNATMVGVYSSPVLVSSLRQTIIVSLILAGMAVVMALDLNDLRKKEIRIQSLLKLSHEALLIHRDGVVLDCNQTFERLFKASLQEISKRGQTIWGFFPDLEDDFSLPSPYPGPKGEPAVLETTARDTEGNLFWVELRASEGSHIGSHITVLSIIDITDRVRWREADLQARTAQAATEAKSMFLANMTHELRTPINGVLASLDVLGRTSLDEEQREFMGYIRVSATQLLDLITDILDFSKIEAGKMELRNSEFNLLMLVDEAINIVARAAYDKGLEIGVFVSDETPIYVIGDPQRIKQVLLNLLSNAIKFTSAGHVLVRVRTIDTWIGIEPARESAPEGSEYQSVTSSTATSSMPTKSTPSSGSATWNVGSVATTTATSSTSSLNPSTTASHGPHPAGSVTSMNSAGPTSSTAVSSVTTSNAHMAPDPSSATLAPPGNSDHGPVHLSSPAGHTINVDGQPLPLTSHNLAQNIAINSERTRMLFEVEDSGIGLREEDIGHLWRVFGQVENGSMTRKHIGTGLGLSISKKLVNMMNGDVHVQSQFGKGSTFSFTAVLLIPPQIQTQDHTAVKTIRDLGSALSLRPPAPPSTPPPSLAESPSSSIHSHISLTPHLTSHPSTTTTTSSNTPTLTIPSIDVNQDPNILEKQLAHLRRPSVFRDVLDTEAGHLSRHALNTDDMLFIVADKSKITRESFAYYLQILGIANITGLSDPAELTAFLEQDNQARLALSLKVKEGITSPPTSVATPLLTAPTLIIFSNFHDSRTLRNYPPTVQRKWILLSTETTKIKDAVVLRKPVGLSKIAKYIYRVLDATVPPTLMSCISTVEQGDKPDSSVSPSSSSVTVSSVSLNSELAFKASKKILLAEDNPLNVKIFSKFLMDAGYSVDVARNGSEAVEAVAKRGYYDVIFMDCFMPVEDGFSATRRIRIMEEKGVLRSPYGAIAGSSGSSNGVNSGHDETSTDHSNGSSIKSAGTDKSNGVTSAEKDKHKSKVHAIGEATATKRQRRIPIVALTANVMKSDEDKCFEAGMDAFVTKPVRKREILTDIVDKYIRM
eukprot:TRINITY_DN1892_c0_g2_i2.p1 TRINITY_DN1892_c0_g2~~TRINITY_DN1892_c0_g2_i2.p1  ORF type:complete len:1291 (-),score=324.87 TRINITY_DN1892_c0_g2_i2:178-4050(-)